MRIPTTGGRAKARPAGKVTASVTLSVYFSIHSALSPADSEQGPADSGCTETYPLCTEFSALELWSGTGSGPTDAPRRELGLEGIAVEAEEPGGFHLVPPNLLEDSKDDLPLELLARFLQ